MADQVTAYFYALLFVRHPELRGLFPAAMDTQRDRLLKALLAAAEHMDNPTVLPSTTSHLGRGHRKYGTQAVHYPAVGEALIGALSRLRLVQLGRGDRGRLGPDIHDDLAGHDRRGRAERAPRSGLVERRSRLARAADARHR